MVDARSVPDGSRVVADVCIIGAGAAGITLARELTRRATSVVVLESGFLESDVDTQALYDGDTRGLAYFPLGEDRTRTRQFGGSTNQWTGECRPLDALDFEARDWVPDSGWPFGLDELRPWYEQAQTVCELSPSGYGAADWPPHARPLAPGDDRIVPVAIQFSPPTRFGVAYRDELSASANAMVYLGANVVDLETSRSPTSVDTARVACLDGRRFTVAARTFVLATGGIENARLLLAANGVHRAGLGNEHDLVGRYFMEHLYLDAAATIEGARRLDRDYARQMHVGHHRIQWALALSESEQRTARATSFVAVLTRAPGDAPNAFPASPDRAWP